MKKLIVFISIFCCSFNSIALTIQQITVSQISSSPDLNVKVKVAEGNIFEFYNSNYTIIGSVITLNVCYTPYILSTVTFLTNNFTIPNLNITANNYTLIVNVNNRIYDGFTYNCDNQIGADTKSLQFSTPLIDPVYLSDTAFTYNYDKISFFPNPVKNELSIVSNQTITVEEINIYNTIGQLVQNNKKPSKIIDVNNLPSGNYLMKIITENGVSIQKFIKE